MTNPMPGPNASPFDPFYGARQYTGPMQNAFAVTPADGTPLPSHTRLIYVGGSGSLTVVLRGDNPNGNNPATQAASVPVTFYNVQAGSFLPLAVLYVKATGTTATNIVALV